MWVATAVVLLYFRFLDAIETKYANASGIVATVMLLLPSIIYAVAIAVMNNLYLRLATFLTQWGELKQDLYIKFVSRIFHSFLG